jgi:uncharacterized surface protein with fasciclin (FAS1) repeats
MTKIEYLIKSIGGIGLLMVFIILITQCDEEAIIPPPNEIELQMMEYIEFHKSIYSEFKNALELTELNHLLKTRGPYTLFLPDNNEKGYSNLQDMDLTYLNNLILNHLIADEIKTDDMGLGSLRKINAIGDYLVSEFDDTEIRINKTSIITDRDIEVANGLIHRISSVIDIVSDDIATVISKDDQYSIFAEALEKTGIVDTLRVLKIPYGRGEARTRYTILAVPDSVYAKEGITSFDQLNAIYGEADANYKDTDHELYKYIDYHCLEGTYYLTDLPDNETLYYTLSRENQVAIRVTSDYIIDYNNSTGDYTGFIKPGATNIPAKNGVLHGINGPLVPQERTTGEYIFYVTQYPDLMEEECYIEKYIKNFYDPDYFAEIKWGGGDYFQYYNKGDNSLEYNDAISMSESYWWIEIRLPKIKKGKYDITAYVKTGPNRANCLVYIDGEKVEDILFMNDNDDPPVIFNFWEAPITTVEWTETTHHYFKLKAISPGIIYWDNLKFIPVE